MLKAFRVNIALCCRYKASIYVHICSSLSRKYLLFKAFLCLFLVLLVAGIPVFKVYVCFDEIYGDLCEFRVSVSHEKQISTK